MGRASDHRVEADAEPRTAGDGLPQVIGAPTSSRASGGCRRGFQKNWPATVETIAQERGLDPSNIEVWFADEARSGQQNKITRRWARRGRRQSAPSDQRTASTYIFGAICPKQGKAVGLILPWCNTAMMNLHLAAISADVAPGCHALLSHCLKLNVTERRSLPHLKCYPRRPGGMM